MASPNILLNSHSTTSTDTSTSIPCGVVHSFDETTIVNAPIQLLWHTLIHVNNGWNWNDRLRFEMDEERTPQQGSVGKFRIYRGKGRWRVKRCDFRQVDRVNRVLEWAAHHHRAVQRVHRIQLTVVDSNTTSLHHTETVERTLPRWWLFLSRRGKNNNNTVKQVHHNAILGMNQSLKHHVESIHFNQLVLTFSTRQFTLGDSKTSTAISDDSTAALSASYWESPPNLRKQIVACYLKDQAAGENIHDNKDAGNNDDDDEGSLQGIDGLPF